MEPEEDICQFCEKSYPLPKADTVYVHDTTYVPKYISNLDEVTREFGLSYDEYVRTFLAFKDENDSLNEFPTEKIYLNYFLPLLNSDQPLFEYRLVTREFLVNSSKNRVKLDLVNLSQADSLEKSRFQTDCMMTIYGADKTNSFLNSSTQIKSCLGQLFRNIYDSKGKIKGVNFYFPDYTFREKKAMAQFVKSASLVIDSCGIESMRSLRLYVSFNKGKAKNNTGFLYGISQMTDSIFLFNYKSEENTLPEISVIDKNRAKDLNLLSKLKNQFYLAKYYTKPFPERSKTEFRIQDINNLIDADYPDNQWEIYLYGITGISLLLLILFLCYLTIPFISYFVNKNMDYVYSILIMFLLEIVILIANMFESMSKDDIFSLNNDNRFIILFLPLLFIFIIPVMKTIGKKRNLP